MQTYLLVCLDFIHDKMGYTPGVHFVNDYTLWKRCYMQISYHVFFFVCIVVDCDHTKSPGEPSTQATSIVMEFWGKVTPGMLHLLTQAKEVGNPVT